MDDLQRLVQSFHDDGFVHGDLRQPNILCDGEKVLLIDFDWGGEIGKTYYPHARLCPELWDGRDSSDPFITKEDDNRILRKTFEGLSPFEGLKEIVASYTVH
jgi:aminoglycoside phosphotransferase